MTRLEIALTAIIIVSMILNVGVFVYARAVVRRLIGISEELWDLQKMSDSLTNHLQSVYELETFYGDQTLQGLLQHATSFNEQMETFEHIYTLVEEEVDDSEANNLAPPVEEEA
tara:strand:+ start:273 stop:614 length:342 start_codon:yes stop_codon:yes gene_type:complete